jgi:anti-sigma factor RsiW
MMQCTDINELMMDFIYRELETKREDEFRAHLASCARCGSELASLERTRHALRELPDAEPPAAVTARLLHEAAKRVPRKAAREEEARGGLLSWLSGLFRPVIAHPAWAAAASLVILVGVVYLRESGVISSRPQSSPPSVEARQEKHAGDKAAALAPTSAAEKNMPEGQATAATGAVTTPAPTTTVTADGYADTTVKLDGKMGGQVLDRIGTLESGDPALRMQTQTPPAKGSQSAKDMGGEVADYRYKNGLEGADDGVADKKKEARRAEQAMDVPADEAEADSDNEMTVSGSKGRAAGGGGSTPVAGAAPAPRPAAPAAEPMPQAARGDAADEPAAMPARKPTTNAKPAPNAPPPPTEVARTNSETRKRDAVKADPTKNKDKQNAGGRNVVGNVQQPTQDVKSEAGLDTSSATMHQQAQRAAKTGKCNLALEQWHKIQKTDPDYFNRNVRQDAVFNECERSAAAKKAKKAAPKAPDMEDEMRESPSAPAPAANEASF